MAELMDYLQRVVDDDASDLFIIAGVPVSQKLDNQLVPIGKERVLPQESKELIAGLYARADRSMDYLGQKDDDFSFSVPGLARFRVNAYQQRGSLAAVVRVVPFSIPDWRELNIPQQVIDLSQVTHAANLPHRRVSSTRSTKTAPPTSSPWRTPSSTSTGTKRASSASGKSPLTPRTILRPCGPACGRPPT